MPSPSRVPGEALSIPFCSLGEIDDFVEVGIEVGILSQLREVRAMFVHEVLMVCLRSPMCVVDNMGAIDTFVQCRCDEAGFIY